jgi:hypothetical protein
MTGRVDEAIGADESAAVDVRNVHCPRRKWVNDGG